MSATFLEPLRRHIARFRGARDGNVAVIFSLALIPMIGLAGAALDYSRASRVRTSMQQVLDATALMLAKNAGNQTSAQMQTLGRQYFKAQFTVTDVKSSKIAVAYSQGDSTVQVTGTAAITTSFLRILGFKKINVAASSTAAFAAKSRLRVALVLDNTGSMSSAGKMPALKTAAKNLLARLKSASQSNGDVYVSIIPFANDVNVGASNSGASWIDWYDWDLFNGSDPVSGCSGGYTYGKNGKKSKKCLTSTTWVADSHTTWNGCVTDRDQNYDTTAAYPNPADKSLPPTTASTLFPADQDNACPKQLLPMTYDWNALNNAVDAMSPKGTTNQAIGLAWGWQSLTDGSVLNPPAKSLGYAYADHIVLLTDGLNTEDRWYTSQASIDARQKIMCDNVKAAGITLWTIQVNTGGDPTSTLLQQCASDSSKFFLLTSADQIISTFDSISFKITQLHISK